MFKDPLALIFNDEIHSAEEPREITIGHSVLNRLVLVCFTERKENNCALLAPVSQPEVSEKSMKKTQEGKQKKVSDDMAAEYHFDWVCFI